MAGEKPVNLSFTKKKNISAFFVVTYYRSFHPHYQQECPNAQHQSCFFSVDFSALRTSLAIQNVQKYMYVDLF